MRVSSVVFVFLLMWSAAAAQQPCFDYGFPSPLSTTVAATGGNVRAIDGDGAHLAVGAGATLNWFEIGTDGVPVLLGTTVAGSTITDVALLGDVAFATAGPAGLHVFDFSDPLTPATLTILPSGSSARGVDADGTHCYWADSDTLRILDVADPANPVQVAAISYDPPAGGDFHNGADYVDVENVVCWTAYSGAPLKRGWDVTDPANPVMVYDDGDADYYLSGMADFDVSGIHVIYVDSYYDEFLYANIYSWRVRDVDTWATVMSGSGGQDPVTVVGGETYVCVASDGTISVRDAMTGDEVLTLPTSYVCNDMYLAGGRLYVSDGSDVVFHDLDGQAGTGLRDLESSSNGAMETGSDIAVGDGVVVCSFAHVGGEYMGDVDWGLMESFDVSNPDSIISLATFNAWSPDGGSYPGIGNAYIHNDLVYVPGEVYEWATGTLAGTTGIDRWITGSGNALYRLDNRSAYGTLDIYDLTDPLVPVLSSNLYGEDAVAMAATADRLCVCVSDIGGHRLDVYDLADPLAPTLAGSATLIAPPEEVQAVGDMIVVRMTTALDLFTAVPGAAPVHETYIVPPTTIYQMALGHDILYAWTGSDGVDVYDVQDPSLPVIKGGFEATEPFRGVGVNGDAFFGVHDAMVSAWKLDCLDEPPVGTGVEDHGPASPFVVEVWPNPFNPATEISFTLDHPGHAELSVYDLAGRRIRTLLDEALPPGNHTRTWRGLDDSGRPMPAGVYLARLRSGDRVESRRMVLLK